MSLSMMMYLHIVVDFLYIFTFVYRWIVRKQSIRTKSGDPFSPTEMMGERKIINILSSRTNHECMFAS